MPATESRISCPQCGARLDPPEGSQLLVCSFCDARLWFDRTAVVSHYRLPALLDESAAHAALRRWMAGDRTVKGLDQRARLLGPELIWFPFWLFRGTGESGERVVLEPAAPTPVAEIADLALPPGGLEPFTGTPEEGRTIEAAVPVETARRWLAQCGMDRAASTALVHAPLWRMRYHFGDREWQTLVDGASGEVFAAVYPEKRSAPFWLVAVVAAVLFFVEGAAIGSPLLRALAYLVTAVPLVIVAWMVARHV